MDDRGGQVLKTGKIGRVNVLRQKMLMPGENIDATIKGKIKLESLRERDSLRINANLSTFATPVRWLWNEWPDFVKEGPSTSRTPPNRTVSDLSKYGIGAFATGMQIFDWFHLAPLRIYNEWWKWPEQADATDWDEDGNIAVPLQHSWSRCRWKVDPTNTADHIVDSGTNFDVRKLAETQAKFRSAMDRDVLSYNRYMELLDEMYGANGSREVDQVPIMIDQQEVGVNPREMAATDGASLGQWQSFFDFEVDHRISGIAMPEHSILTTVLCVRFASISEEREPQAKPGMSWAEIVGDGDILGSMMPQEVKIGDVMTVASDTSLGYLPAGWQWRNGTNVVGSRIDGRDSFPYMKRPTSQANAKDATRIKNAFRSQSLGDYVVDLYFSEKSRNRLNTPLESYYSGMKGQRNDDQIPKQGKMQ